MELIPEYANYPTETFRIESDCSSLIKLDAEVSEGESLHSSVIRAMAEANKLKKHLRENAMTRSSQELAESMLHNKSKEDSTFILA